MKVVLTLAIVLVYGVYAFAQTPTPKRGELRGKELEEEAAGKKSSISRPKLHTQGWEQKAVLAEQMGKPIIYWVDTSPFENDDADEFFISFPEAIHLLINAHPTFPGQTHGVVFKGKDGWDYWVRDGRLNVETATKVREKWVGERRVLTDDDKRKVLQRMVRIQLQDGSRQEMTVDGYVARGGSLPQWWCEQAGLSPEETEFAMALKSGRPQVNVDTRQAAATAAANGVWGSTGSTQAVPSQQFPPQQQFSRPPAQPPPQQFRTVSSPAPTIRRG